MAVSARAPLVGLAMSFVGFLVNIVAISTSHWLEFSDKDEGHMGLFRSCSIHSDPGLCYDIVTQLQGILDQTDVVWYRSVQVCFTISAVGGLVGFFLSALLVLKFFQFNNGYKPLSIINALTLILQIAALLVFGLNGSSIIVPDVGAGLLGWSFYTATAAGIIIFFTTLFYVAHATMVADALQTVHQRITIWSSPYRLFIQEDI